MPRVKRDKVNKSAAAAVPVADSVMPTTESEVNRKLQEVADAMTSMTKPTRSVGWRWRSADGLYGILSIRNGNESVYFVRRIAEGVYAFTKLEHRRETTYIVDMDNDLCGCEGHRKHGHCKHVEALVAMTEGGRL